MITTTENRRGGGGFSRWIRERNRPKDPLIEAMKTVQVEEAYRAIFLRDLKLIPKN